MNRHDRRQRSIELTESDNQGTGAAGGAAGPGTGAAGGGTGAGMGCAPGPPGFAASICASSRGSGNGGVGGKY